MNTFLPNMPVTIEERARNCNSYWDVIKKTEAGAPLVAQITHTQALITDLLKALETKEVA